MRPLTQVESDTGNEGIDLENRELKLANEILRTALAPYDADFAVLASPDTLDALAIPLERTP